jgi:hypothetical protein
MSNGPVVTPRRIAGREFGLGVDAVEFVPHPDTHNVEGEGLEPAFISLLSSSQSTRCRLRRRTPSGTGPIQSAGEKIWR